VAGGQARRNRVWLGRISWILWLPSTPIGHVALMTMQHRPALPLVRSGSKYTLAGIFVRQTLARRAPRKSATQTARLSRRVSLMISGFAALFFGSVSRMVARESLPVANRSMQMGTHAPVRAPVKRLYTRLLLAAGAHQARRCEGCIILRGIAPRRGRGAFVHFSCIPFCSLRLIRDLSRLPLHRRILCTMLPTA